MTRHCWTRYGRDALLALLVMWMAIWAAPAEGAAADCAASHLTREDQFTCLDSRRKRLEKHEEALRAGITRRIERDALLKQGAKQAYLEAVKASAQAWDQSRAATCAMVPHSWTDAESLGRKVASERCQVSELEARIGQLTRITGATPIASMLEVPVEVASRKALLGPGHVVQINNLLDESITVQLTLMRNAVGEKSHQTVTIGASGRVELGHKEGLPFAPGDELIVESGEYMPLRARIRQ